MYLAGTIALVASMVMALLASIAYILVIRGNRAALLYARAGVYGTLASIMMVWTLLMVLFLTRRFDFEYVNNYSSRDLDTFFTIAAIWAGQSGSFAIWVLLGAVVAVLVMGRARHFEPYVLPIITFSLACMAGFTLILNPFSPLIDPNTGLVLTPPDGSGLNPLLHNFWMISHPPILFVGYALAIVPFAFAIAGLIRRDYDTWVTRALPWTLAAWAFLGLALLLGAYWAYETLGWGGYWGWDPVENSSLVPWILLTALLHGMLVQRSHGSLRRTNLLLAIWSYIAVFYATFLTRSGVLANFSVHTFVAEGIYGVMLAFLLLLIVGSTVVMALRWRDIPSRSLSDQFFSRDDFFGLGILTLVITAVVIILGTSMPVISAIPGVGHWLQGVLGAAFELDDGSAMGGTPFQDGRFNVATSFYGDTTPIFGIVVVALMALAPLLGWRDTNIRKMLLALRWPGALTVVATCVALLLGVRDPLPLAYVALSTLAVGVNVLMIVRTLRGGWLRIGGYLAHVGLALMFIGVVGSSAYASPDERLSFASGDTVSYRDYEFTFNGWQQAPDGGGVLDLTVQRGDEVFNAQPELYLDGMSGSAIQNPHIVNYLSHDLYISPADYVPENDPTNPLMGVGDVLELGPYEITFDGFQLDENAMMSGHRADVGARLAVLYEGEESIVVPRLQLIADPETGETRFEQVVADMPGGHTIALTSLYPDQRLVFLQAAGPGIDELPVQPERAVVAVSIKPAVGLVWIGALILIVGGTIAFFRRYLEGQARLSGQPVKLPRGLGLAGKFGWRGSGAAR